MTNPWKRSKISSFSRFVASLRSKRNPSSDSPLLVQTGFPTSLADLVVKHRRHRKSHHPRITHKSNVASRVSDIVAVVEASQIHHHHLDDDDDNKEEQPPEETRVDPVVPEVVQRPAFAPRSTAGRSVGSQAKAVLLMALAVSTKEVVLGIMISAIVLLLLESLGGRLLDWIRRREAARSVVVEVLELDSSIRGVPTSGFDPATANLQERCDLAGCVEEEVVAKAKKKHWRKLFSEKFRGSRRRKDDEKVPASDSVHSSSPESSGEEEAVEVEDGDINNDIVFKEEKVEECCKSNGRSYLVFLLIVVLSGLVGGKVAALVLTVACCSLMEIMGVFHGNNHKLKA